MSMIKTAQEIEIMTRGGQRLARIRKQLLDAVVVGAVPHDIDQLAQKLIAQAGGKPSFMTVKDYQWATCISVNEGVVHGVPTKNPFKKGDVVSLDVGMLYDGYHTDTSWTVYLPSENADVDKNVTAFLKAGEQALYKAISQARAGNKIGHVSRAIQETIEGAGYQVVPNLVGHGVGKTLHEAPQVPGVVQGSIEHTVPIKPGMVLAIEVIYTKGSSELIYPNSDGWTLSTADGEIAGLYEETVLVTENSPIILTKS